MSQKPAALASLFAHWLNASFGLRIRRKFFLFPEIFSKKTSNGFKIKKTQYKVLSF